MGAIIGAIGVIGAFVLLLVRRILRGGEPGTVEQEERPEH